MFSVLNFLNIAFLVMQTGFLCYFFFLLNLSPNFSLAIIGIINSINKYIEIENRYFKFCNIALFVIIFHNITGYTVLLRKLMKCIFIY